MAEQGVLRDAKIWLGGYDITGMANSVRLSHSCEAVDNTMFGDATRSEAGGLKAIAFEVAGRYGVDGDDEADDILSTNLAVSNTPISLGVQTGALGEVGYTFQSLQAQYEIGASVGELLSYRASASARGTPLVRGTIMHVGAETSTDTETGYQVGAVAAGERMYAALHVTAASGGSPTLDVTIQSDDNGSFTSATTRITLAQQTDIGSTWGSVAGAITDDYWRVAFTIGGSTPSFTFAVVIGIV